MVCKKVTLYLVSKVLLIVALINCGAAAQGAPQVNVTEIEKQKQATDKEIKETKSELSANESKVSKSLTELRKIDDEIAVSKKEIETVRGQIETINRNIGGLEADISSREEELDRLRSEYLKAVKKMRVARKQNSGLAFIFSSGSFNEARRRMRYMREFSEWKERRSGEISGKVAELQNRHSQLSQAKSDASVALQREEKVQAKLAGQKKEQMAAVESLKAHSEELRSKLAKRQAEARQLSNQISALIAEQRAKEAREAEERRKAEEMKRLEEEKRAAEERARAEQLLAEEKAKKEAIEKETGTKDKKTATEKKEKTPKPSKESKQAGGTEYADARKRKPRTTASATSSGKSSETVDNIVSGMTGSFEGMKGSLPKPVSGSFRIVSSFGVHPISPELPDIMDENLGIDAQVATGATACAVYDGEVIKIYDRTNTPGFRNIIVLKHGDYITVYANLESLSVKTGQKVKQGQSLGSVGTDFDDPSHGMIHFEVWKNQTHLDPAAWIKI